MKVGLGVYFPWSVSLSDYNISVAGIPSNGNTPTSSHLCADGIVTSLVAYLSGLNLCMKTMCDSNASRVCVHEKAGKFTDQRRSPSDLIALRGRVKLGDVCVTFRQNVERPSFHPKTHHVLLHLRNLFHMEVNLRRANMNRCSSGTFQARVNAFRCSCFKELNVVRSLMAP